MSSRLAFQTQLASIMEVLANAAVAEICKLVDDDYAVVSLQMSQCQRENKALKRKLHLLELKMARGNAERRLRESAMNNGRSRVHINTADRLRESSLSTGGAFERRMEVALWSSRAAVGDAGSEQIHSDSMQSKSPDVELVEPDVELVEPDADLVKEEKEAMMSRGEDEDVPLIGDDGVVERVPRGPTGQRPNPEPQDTQSTSSQSQIQNGRTRRSSSSRGAERKNDVSDVVMVKLEEVENVTENQSQTSLSIQEGLVESSTDDFRAVLPFNEMKQTSSNALPTLQECGPDFSESAVPDPVQLRVPDTNTPANPKTHPQTSDYSLFELETFFTRWAPDGDSVSAPSGPFATDDSAQCDQDGVMVVETRPPPALQPPQSSAVRRGPSFSSVHIQPSQKTPGSVPVRMQPPSSQPLWGKKSIMLTTTQAQLLQHHRDTSRISQPHFSLHSATPTVSNSHKAAKASLSGVSPVTMNPTAAPPRPTAACIEVTIEGQHQAGLLAHQNHTQTLTNTCRKKSYGCRVCGKAFSGLSNLEAHQRVHTGEKPFCCDTCGKRFSEAGNLKKHQRVHTGEKPFSCDQCGKRFAWICNLRTHQQSATGCGLQARGGLGLG